MPLSHVNDARLLRVLVMGPLLKGFSLSCLLEVEVLAHLLSALSISCP